MTEYIGQQIKRYHILMQIGEGGMATVYKAFDPNLEIHVAVKVILPHFQHSDKFLKRFENEAKSLAQLAKHHNIVHVMDYGEYKGLPFLVMEYVAGGTYKQYMGKSVHWMKAAAMLAPVARALEYAHQNKIIHRDVKPSNILVSDRGDPILADFGVVKILEIEAGETRDMTGTGVGMGTPEYMSPEQGLGKPIDYRADTYALGVVFYEMITGHKPFQSDNPMEVVIKQVREKPLSPKKYVKDLPEGVIWAINKALSKEPDDRFQKIGEFADVLETLSRGETVPVEKMGKPVHKTRSKLSWVLLSILTLCILTGGGIWLVPSLLGLPPLSEHIIALASSSTPTLSQSTVPTRTRRPSATLTATSTGTPSQTVTTSPTLTMAATSTLTPMPVLSNPPTPFSFALVDTPVVFSGQALQANNLPGISQIAIWGTGKVVQAVRSMDGSKIAVAAAGGIYIYETKTWGQIGYSPVEGWVHALVFSPDGNQLIYGANKNYITSLSLEHDFILPVSKQVQVSGQIWTLAYSQDGNLLAVGTSEKAILLLNPSSLQVEGEISGEKTGHAKDVTSLAFSPDSKILASGSLDRTIRLWDISSRQNQKIFYGFTGRTTYLVFSPDGKFLASGSVDGTVRVLNLEKGNTANTFYPSHKGVSNLAFSPDGGYLVSTTEDDKVQFWDLTKSSRVWEKTISLLPHVIGKNEAYPNSVMFIEDGNKVLVWSWTSTAKILDAATGEDLDTLDPHSYSIYNMAFSPDGKKFVSDNHAGTVLLRDPETGKILHSFQGFLPQGEPFSPDSQLLVLISDDQTLKVWDVGTHKERFTLVGHPSRVVNVDFSKDGTLLAVGNERYVKIWATSSGQAIVISRIQSGTYCTTAYLPSDIATAVYSELGLVQMNPRSRLCEMPKPPGMTSLIFTDDGMSLAISVGTEIWLRTTDDRVLPNHMGIVRALAFSPDNNFLISGADDQVVKIWSVQNGTELASIRGHLGSVTSVAISPDGKYIISASLDGTLRLWGIR